MGSSYAAGLPFHIIADARAAFERLVKGLTEAVREQRLAGPEPQIPASASSTSSASRLRIIEKTKSAITSAGGAALDSSRRHRSRSVSFAVMSFSYAGGPRIDGLGFGSRRLLITRGHHHRIVDLILNNPNNEPSGMYATVRPRSYLCRTQNIALQVPTSQLNAQRNMESLTASFITWIVEPSSALKI
jgi:hypothetical protein